MYQGHGDAKQERDNGTEKLFRYVDRLVLDLYASHRNFRRSLFHFQNCFPFSRTSAIIGMCWIEGIENAYDSLDKDMLKAKALEMIKSIKREKILKVVESYAMAEAEGHGFSDLNTVAKAAFNSRIATLLREESNIVPGKINRATGEVKYGDPAFDDLLDDIAELILIRKGDVLVISKEMMPSTTGVAAIFRY